MTSILRRKQLEHIADIKLAGDVIDLGAKSRENSYFELLEKTDVTSFTFADYFHSGPDIVQIDFEKPFDIEDARYDEILAFNVLEHIYNYDRFVNECYRIAKPGARFHMVVPFIWKFHEDPYDFHRYTHQALEKTLVNNGWEVIDISPTLDGQFSVVCALFESYLPRFLKRYAQTLAMSIDAVINKVGKRGVLYPLDYNVQAYKK